MKETDKKFNVSEVKLVYKNRVKASERFKITGPEDAAEIFFEVWDFEIIDHIEEVKMLLLNRAHHVLGIVNLSTGGITGSVIDTKVVLQYAIKANACGVILGHNHPSGNLNPSSADIHVTKRLNAALEAVDINLLDHIIINSEREYHPINAFY